MVGPLLSARQVAQQPQAATPVAARYRPIGGLLPSAYGVYDSSGVALTVGANTTRSVFAEGVSLSTPATTVGLWRAVAPTTYPATFVFVGRVGSTGTKCLGSLATTADKLFRVYGRDGLVDAQHIGATSNATATTAQAWNFGAPFVAVAVFASPTEVRVYAKGALGAFSASSAVNVGAVTGLNRMSFAAYNGSGVTAPLDGSTALAQWLGVALTDAEAKALLVNPWQIFAPATSLDYVSTGVAGVVALTGVESATAAGSLGPVIADALTGTFGTGAAGSVGPTIADALTGTFGSGSAGTLGTASAPPLTSASSAGTAGAVTARQDVVAALTGASSAGSAGSLVASQAVLVAVSGTSGAGSAGAVGADRASALTGTSGTAAAGSLVASQAVLVAVPGTSGAGSAGAVGADRASALPSTSSAGAAGLIAASRAVAATGTSGAGAAGALAASQAAAVPGTSGAGSAGAISTDSVVPLAGAESTAASGIVVAVISPSTDPGTVALTGISGTGAPGTLSSASDTALVGTGGAGAAGAVGSALALALNGSAGTSSTGSLAASNAPALAGTLGSAAAGSVIAVSSDVVVALTGVQSLGRAGTLTQTGGTPPPDPFLAIIGGGIARKLKKQREDEETELARRTAAQALTEARLTEFVPAPRTPRAPRMTSNGLTDSVDGTAQAVARKSRQRSEDDLMLMY